MRIRDTNAVRPPPPIALLVALPEFGGAGSEGGYAVGVGSCNRWKVAEVGEDARDEDEFADSADDRSGWQGRNIKTMVAAWASGLGLLQSGGR